MAIDYKNNVVFPDHLAPKEIKDDEKFGRQVGSAILNSTAEYRQKRNTIIALNRRFAEGRQPVEPYLDQMSIDGKSPFVNIRFKPRPIASKFHKIVVDGYALRKEYAKCTSLSKHIQDRKDKKKSDAMFRMEFQQELAQLSQESGLPVEDPNAFVPENKEELDIYFSLNDKEKEELLMQEIVTFTLHDNHIDEIKKQFLGDIFDCGLAGYYNYLDSNGRLVVDYIQPEDAIYSSSQQENLSRDARYTGRILRLTVAEVRSRFNLSSTKEKELWNNARKFSGKLGNPNGEMRWSEDYRFAQDRPYDGHIIEILHFWWKCNKVIGYVEGKDRYGREVFDITRGSSKVEKKDNPRKKAGKATPQTAYEGFMLTNGSCILQWEEHRNILRKGEDRQEVVSPFIFYMPGNTGNMLVPSSVNMMIDSIELMDIAILKIKQIIASVPPDGYVIDIDSLVDVDLGAGVGIVSPLTLDSIFRQTGNIYYKRIKDDGETPNQVPFQPTASPFLAKIQAFINEYNFELGNIRDYLGVNEFRDGSSTDARISSRFAQSQLDSSNTATWSIYNAYVKATEELVRQIATRIWDSLNYGEPNKGYLQFLGKKNVDLIKEREDITRSNYDFVYELEMQQGEREALEQNIQTCLANGSLEMPDAMMIRDVYDSKLAIRMLNYFYEKRRKQRIEEADANQKSAAEYASQAGVAVEQEKQKSISAEAEIKLAVEREKGAQDRDKELEKAAWQMMLNSQETGKEIPPMFMGVFELVMQNRGISLNMEADAKMKEAQMIAEQEQQIAEQQGMQ